MRKFEMEILIGGRPCLLQAEELDPWPDPDSYVRYAISGHGRSDIIAIDSRCWKKPIIWTEEDAWAYLEQLLYPERPLIYSLSGNFAAAELETIRQQMVKQLTLTKS